MLAADISATRQETWMIAMARIRAFEETLAEAHEQDKLVGGVHLAIGQEATAAGFAGLLRDGDQITTSHRGHHHMVARGLDPRRLYAEIQGRATGYCRGKGGSMHVSSFEDGVAGANGVVAGGIPMTWGLSVAAKERGDGTVAICFFGDGAANQGVLYETLNLAACWRSPIVFVCENNGWGQFSAADGVTAGPGIHTRAKGFGVPALEVDGNDVSAVEEAARTALGRARGGDGPTFVECLTSRWRGHHEGEERYAGEYRVKAEYVDPLQLLAERMNEAGGGGGELRRQSLAAAREEMGHAFELAENDPEPELGEALEDVFA